MCQTRVAHATPRLQPRLDVIRAWTDDEYRQTLSAADLALLPENPAGAIELDEAVLDYAAGGLLTAGCTCSCSHHNCNTLT
jgi:mersacidin/lichenicidin family type 2 lantibiotic